jgi:hypothetical protein
MGTRNVSVLIGPYISLYVKLWGFFIAIIEQTGARGTWVFASSGAPHDDTWVKIQGKRLQEQVRGLSGVGQERKTKETFTKKANTI